MKRLEELKQKEDNIFLLSLKNEVSTQDLGNYQTVTYKSFVLKNLNMFVRTAPCSFDREKIKDHFGMVERFLSGVFKGKQSLSLSALKLETVYSYREFLKHSFTSLFKSI